MSGHAFFPPSSAAEIISCSLYATMLALYPKEDTQDSQEGHAAHWAAAELYHCRPVDVGQIAPNGVMLAEEIIESAEAFASALHNGDWTVERPAGNKQSLNWGTPDARQYLSDWLRIKDLKHGFRPVWAYEWWQGINYAKLLVEDYRIPDHVGVELEIVQPRVWKGPRPDVWTTTVGALRPYFQRLDDAFLAAQQPNPEARTGEQCDYCPGRHACPTLQASGLRIAHTRGESPPMDLPDQALGREAITLRRSIAIMQARLTGLEADAEARLKRGRPVAFHTLGRVETRETWTIPDDQVIETGAAMGVNLAKPKPITPNQARKAGISPEIIAMLAHRPNGGTKLVEDDGRAAAKVFDGGGFTS